jgi:phosphopantetheinyl transferase (holo-ACP synthase)
MANRGRPHYGTLTKFQQELLHDEGFSRYEIAQYDQATKTSGEYEAQFDLSSPVWLEVIAERRERIHRIKEAYYKATGRTISKSWLYRQINLFYVQHPKTDPFDWLKKAYRKIKHISSKTVATATRKLQGFLGARPYTVKAEFD